MTTTTHAERVDLLSPAWGVTIHDESEDEHWELALEQMRKLVEAGWVALVDAAHEIERLAYCEDVTWRAGIALMRASYAYDADGTVVSNETRLRLLAAQGERVARAIKLAGLESEVHAALSRACARVWQVLER